IECAEIAHVDTGDSDPPGENGFQQLTISHQHRFDEFTQGGVINLVLNGIFNGAAKSEDSLTKGTISTACGLSGTADGTQDGGESMSTWNHGCHSAADGADVCGKAGKAVI